MVSESVRTTRVAKAKLRKSARDRQAELDFKDKKNKPKSRFTKKESITKTKMKAVKERKQRQVKCSRDVQQAIERSIGCDVD